MPEIPMPIVFGLALFAFAAGYLIGLRKGGAVAIRELDRLFKKDEPDA